MTELELVEKLSGLKKKPDLKELLQGVKTQERVDKILVILLDSSGSMTNIMETSSKISIAWKVLQDELMPNMTGWTYGVVLFHDDAYWDILPCNGIGALLSKRAPMACGMTSMGKALQISWSWVKGHAKQARFVMLTDGMPNDISKKQILAMASENSSIPIDTVGIGTGTFEYDPVFLAELSSITGGIFVEVDSVKLLADTILKLSPSNRPLLGTVE